jgi:hypothetical protein
MSHRVHCHVNEQLINSNLKSKFIKEGVDPVKVVFVGHPQSMKTVVLATYGHGAFPEYIPTFCENVSSCDDYCLLQTLIVCG